MGVRTYVGLMFGTLLTPELFSRLLGQDDDGVLAEYQKQLCADVDGRWSSEGISLCRREGPYNSIDGKPHVVGFWVALSDSYGEHGAKDFDCASLARIPVAHLSDEGFFNLPEDVRAAMKKAEQRWAKFSAFVVAETGDVLTGELLFLADWR